MSHEYDAEEAAYETRIRAMVLVDTALDAHGDEVFVVKFDGQVHGDSADIRVACDLAADMAAGRGCKWDVTIQARNAADMS